MYNFQSALSSITRITNMESRSISAENFTGKKGKGGMATEGTGAKAASALGQGWKVSPSIEIKPGETFTLAEIDGPGIIKHIWITNSSNINRKLILRIYWDESDAPSVECPLGDFFASADEQQYNQISSLPVCVNANRALNCYWEMPFYKKCKITLENTYYNDGDAKNIIVYYQIDYILTELPKGCAYFHAQFRRINPLPYKDVYTILDNVEGNGQYVGTYMLWGTNNNGWWGEGEIKFYLDGDKEFPTICGTGTEDYFCGAWCFADDDGYKNYSTPYSGFAKLNKAKNPFASQERFSMYRWHIQDPIYFKKDIKITMQALGWREFGTQYLPLQDDISSVAFWYQDSICKTFPKLPSKEYLSLI